MRLYRVEEIEGLKDQVETWKKIGKEYAEREAKNDEAFSDLAEQLRQEQAKYIKLYTEYSDLIQDMKDKREAARQAKAELNEKVENLKIRLKDSPIKAGLKRIWKWFKGLVGK